MRKVLTIAFVGMCLSSVALAGDSPQFRGPNRDGRFDEEGLLETWPAARRSCGWRRGSADILPLRGGRNDSCARHDDETTAAIFILSTGGAIDARFRWAETEDKQARSSLNAHHRRRQSL